ncbi:MAG: hypothetical protein ACREQ2_22305 [Candidatus Binatia bacterium]
MFFTIATALLARAAQSRACAVCLTGSSDGVTDGYNASVLFLLSTPYLVVGAIVGALILTYRRAQQRQVENSEPAVTVAWQQEESGR